jgi:hypothetical protein
MKINKNSVSLAGEFAVLSKLALHGYDANMTLGNTKGVDILAAGPNGKTERYEVKTARKCILGKYGTFKGTYKWLITHKPKGKNRGTLIYFFVLLEDESGHMRFFKVPEQVVLKYSENAHKHWLTINKAHKDSHMRVFRLGQGKESFKITAPLLKKYEVWD